MSFSWLEKNKQKIHATAASLEKISIIHSGCGRISLIDLLSSLHHCTGDHLCRIPELLRDWVVFRCLTPPPPLCIFTVGQQMFSWLSPVFWAIYSASSLGMKASTPTNKPWTIWWRTVWALSSVVFELLATAAAYHICQNMFAYIWIVKYWTPRTDNRVPEKGTCGTLFPTISVCC